MWKCKTEGSPRSRTNCKGWSFYYIIEYCSAIKIIVPCNNMDESQMCCAKWKKPDTKGYIPYGSIFMMFWNRQNYRNREQISVCQGLRWGERGTDYKGAQENSFGVMEMFHTLIMMVATCLYMFVRIHKTVHLTGWILPRINYTSILTFKKALRR